MGKPQRDTAKNGGLASGTTPDALTSCAASGGGVANCHCDGRVSATCETDTGGRQPAVGGDHTFAEAMAVHVAVSFCGGNLSSLGCNCSGGYDL